MRAEGGVTALRSTSAYSDTGPLAVLARLTFLVVITAIVVATLAPGWLVPQLLYSHNLEHFAAFYVATVAALAALPHAQVRRIAVAYMLFSLVLQFVQVFREATPQGALENWVADTGGIAAAVAPVVVERFRQAVARATRNPPPDAGRLI
jgi:hypothetical protein